MIQKQKYLKDFQPQITELEVKLEVLKKKVKHYERGELEYLLNNIFSIEEEVDNFNKKISTFNYFTEYYKKAYANSLLNE